MMMPIRRTLTHTGLMLILLGAGTSWAQVSVPVLKWQRGGCFASWCETGWYSSPAAADLDGDGQDEVIWGSYDLVVIDGSNGSLRARAANSSRVWPGVAVADLTHDGTLEIIVGRGSDQLTVYRPSVAGSTMTLNTLWTRNPFGGGEVRTLAVADLEGDGQLEIIVGRAGNGATEQINVYEPNGSVRPGWPARHNGDPGYGWGMYNENVAVADVDGDGLKEVIGPTDTHYITALDGDGEQLGVHPVFHLDAGMVWSEVGVHVDAWVDIRGYANCGTEHRPNFANMAPAVADLDGDGAREIIALGDVYNCAVGDGPGDLYIMPWILNLDRTRWIGSGYNWSVLPTPGPGSGPLIQNYNVIENSVSNAVIADLDGDGEQEILYAAYDGKVHAYWLDKTEHGNWPYTVPGVGLRFASEPIVVDLDNNGQAEVIFTSWGEKASSSLGQVHILSSLGNSLHAVTLPTSWPALGWNGGLGAPTIANIDADADYELVCGTSHSGVVAYDLPGSASARILWGTGRGGYQRTGLGLTDNIFADGFESGDTSAW
jgi:hypothetical protein